ncbi:unnamed protein product [Meganyctiphanes norvegica]|uniref:BTB domain-containing protein n=1 Tax=Meganyctiphanes norvegica TaxID=48144 RepID=A0AAV2SJY9_MEGNR
MSASIVPSMASNLLIDPELEMQAFIDNSKRSLVKTDYIEENITEHNTCKRVIINVSGLKFETQLRTLNQFPNTLLGEASRRNQHFDPQINEYFFDRNRTSFEAILNYYQSGGRLKRPINVPLDVFLEEIQFFDLGEATLRNIWNDEGGSLPESPPLPENNFKHKIWQMFDEPSSSIFARIITIISLSFILISIVSFCMETLPRYKHYKIITDTDNSTIMIEDETPELGDPFFIVESVCVAWFTFELIVRFMSCPNKVDFIRGDLMNIIDIVAILPYFFTLTKVLSEEYFTTGPDNPNLITDEDGRDNQVMSLAVIRVMRLIRVFRIFKLTRYSKGLRLIGRALKASLKELSLLIFFLCIGVVLFASAVYFAEVGAEDSHFQSIPDAFWWAVVTMTTVGYGDMTPVGVWGKIVGAMTAVAGVIVCSLPISIICSNFDFYYQRDNEISTNFKHVDTCPCNSSNSDTISFSKAIEGAHSINSDNNINNINGNHSNNTKIVNISNN